MNFEVGMEIHDIYNRDWYKIIEITENRIKLVSHYGSFKSTTKSDLERLYKASPLNPLKLDK